jgi:spore coat polysaccharide biosynthesis protein SpsF
MEGVSMRIIASVEARMGSSRFPGKVLADVCGKPAIERLVDRLKKCKLLHGIVIATTTSSKDDPLVAWCKQAGVSVYRGSEDDVLQRVCEAQRFMKSDVVVEITGDCPLIDPEIVDLGIKTYLENECDVASNTWKLTFPMGIDAQVFKLSLLEEVSATIHDEPVREHVSLYFYEHPERYKITHFFAPDSWYGPELRFQLDYEEDLQFIREMYSRLEVKHGPVFGMEPMMQLLRAHPELIEINRHCKNKAVR